MTINRRDFIKKSAGALALSSLFPGVSALAKPVTKSADGKPFNVLFIAFDDMNDYPTFLRHYPGVKTPNLDAFHKTAVNFTNAHCSATCCQPSRTAILSGLAPWRTGHYKNGQHWPDSELLKATTPLPQVFKDAGYHTMGCGKIFHAGPEGKQWDDMWDDYEGGEGKFAPIAVPHVFPKELRKRSNLYSYGVTEEKRISDFKLAPLAEKRLAGTYDKPFFMVHGIRYPHCPHVVPQRFLDMIPDEDLVFPPPGYRKGDMDDVPEYGRKLAAIPQDIKLMESSGHWKPYLRHYLASIAAADELFGRVIAALDNSPYRDNTIVIVWSDHAYHMGEKDHFAKFALWEQATRVPFLIRVPGVTDGGRECKRPVSLQDIYPTLLDLCHLPDPPHKLSGNSLTPLIKNPEQPWPHPAITAYSDQDFAVRDDRYRYIRYGDGSEELYDHEKDPREWTNLASNPEYAEVKAELATHLPTNPAPSVDYRKMKRGKRMRNTKEESLKNGRDEK